MSLFRDDSDIETVVHSSFISQIAAHTIPSILYHAAVTAFVYVVSSLVSS